MNTVRVSAARVLLALDDGRTTLAHELDRARRELSDARDRALLGELTAGTLRWRAELDAVISQASHRRVTQIDRRALAVLRLGTYQIRHLDRIPSHAIVNESVDAVRVLGASRATGFVNAVLRGLLRLRGAPTLPPRVDAAAPIEAQRAYLAITLSHPEWLIARWLSRYPYEAVERWCQFNNAAPPVTIRSIGRLTVDELLVHVQRVQPDATRSEWVHDAIRLPPGTLGRLPPAVRAECAVHDEGAQLIARVAGVRPGEHVLDVCAAPGGKALVAAADLHLHDSAPGSCLVAADFRPARVRLLLETLVAAGLHVPILRLDARKPLPFQDVFDIVIVDAPCSGLGTLRRDPDLKWIRQAGDLEGLVDEQRAMIRQASAAVRRGGRLVYATCSSEPEENAEVVEQFLRTHPHFTRVSAADTCPAAARALDDDGHLMTLPFRDGLDAFFAAVLVRSGSA